MIPQRRTHVSLLLAASIGLIATGCEPSSSRPPIPETTTSSPPEEHPNLPAGSEPEAGSQIVADRLTNIKQNDPMPETATAPAQFLMSGTVTKIVELSISVQTEQPESDDQETSVEIFALSDDVVIYRKGDESGETLTLSDLKPGQSVTLIMERQEDRQDGVLSVVRKIQLPPSLPQSPSSPNPERT